MRDRLHDLFAGVDERAILFAAAGWLALTVLTLAVVAVVVVTLPVTYFVAEATAPAMPGTRGWLRRVGRNAAGVALILLGAVLSLPGIPGQGLLTILIGAMLVDFPGRRRLERWLARRHGVLAALNRLRARWGKPPLLPPAG